ncbi:HEPN domain-containing protein [Sphingomonas sp. PP-CC-3A-396]|uniref:HEPN domain-containing protein n=1 Tax=Sphingomonas sp. PP-CC-3A-396 TaxID=2135655 RepID=UPI00104C85CC|nr:HEPN domain-containing protein [Sphingomonas sp. PP-CC-3A-396]TCQ06396.1 hypothetical protein C8J40_105184 [Sphingomonas sp. PP-CC-3A-396]
MASYSNLLDKVLADTATCQDETTPEFRARAAGNYPPLGAFLGLGYPTTDAALDAVCEIADRFRINDKTIELTVTRDQWRVTVSNAIGANLDALLHEADPRKRWSMMRDRLKEVGGKAGMDLVHYTAVWLFVGQELEPFSIGPVRFFPRDAWADEVGARLGSEPEWREPLTLLWAGRRLHGRSWLAGAKALLQGLVARQLTWSNWRGTFRFHSEAAEPRRNSDARSMVRFAHPDQWIASAHVIGFGRDASNKRGLLATRVALDTIRLVLAQGHRHLIRTASDDAAPLSADGVSQLQGADVSRRWQMNRPGVSGAPHLAQTIITSYTSLFKAAGRCIEAATNISSAHPCPKLAERWLNACHWFGRACLSDADFTAVVMLVISLDVLCGGLMDRGIVELVARLHDIPASQQVLPGMTLKKLVEDTYKLRSEVAHGSILAVNGQLDVERSRLESLAAVAITEYGIKLDLYATQGGADDRDDFRVSLPTFKP